MVSVTDQINEPRYPSFKGIMAAKKKPSQVWSLADLDVRPARSGWQRPGRRCRTSSPRPPREAGQVITDEGDGGKRLVEFLATAKLV